MSDHASHIFDLSAAANPRIGVVSDTHATPHPMLEERLRVLSPELILHAGDVGSARVVDRLEAIAPLVAVLGNTDSATLGLPGSADVRLELPDGAELKLLLLHIGVYGGGLRKEVRSRATHYHSDLVVCGHSHVPLWTRDNGLGVFNPGSAGPRRHNLPIVFGALEVTPDGLVGWHIDCETGQPWTPA